ncbi:probable MFS multidrug transporter [Phialocephala subalpina]|uniref:Probable MFS multidrug transporter n=1 Tax=Phialocephala subalpina TaxID=576137 RepID=A0A1L7WV82_9HELO|nr:probable MFS multidrug transporter [Phialocephala subalpina]
MASSPPSSSISDTSPVSSRPDHNALDLEKQETAIDAPLPRQNTSTTQSSARARITRTQSLTGRGSLRGRFTHPLSHVKTTADSIVDFDGPDDPYHPINWPFRKKLVTTLLYGLTTMGSTWASSVYAPAITQISTQYHVGNEVGLLGLSFLLLGFGLGPLLWAPLSEVYGRKPAVLAPYFIAGCFSFGTATAKDIQTVLITRFFAGLFGSAPVTNTGGVLGDIWSPGQRGTAIVGYAFAVVGGPTLGPIAGGAIVSSYLRWRWTEYITAIMMMFFLLLDVLILDESYPPVLLVTKARRLRHETGNWALHARHEEWDVSVKELANKFLKTPFRLLATPICFLVALYASFVYGILYLCLAAIPIQFAEERGWGPVTSELPFLALLLGTITGGFANIFNNKFYLRKFEKNGNKAVPEARLPPMMFGSVFFAAGLFIFGWTSPVHVFWLAPLIGLFCMGFGFFTIFQAALNYLIDTFARFSASAVAANTFLRSVFAAAFPLFVNPMFHNLGIGWASSILGFVAVAMIPIPFLFYVYGPSIRKRGKFTALVM